MYIAAHFNETCCGNAVNFYFYCQCRVASTPFLTRQTDPNIYLWKVGGPMQLFVATEVVYP